MSASENAAGRDPDSRALALIAFLAAEPQPVAVARVCKAMGLSRSELNRLVLALGSAPGCEGLGLIESTHADARGQCLSLSATGRQLWMRAPQ